MATMIFAIVFILSFQCRLACGSKVLSFIWPQFCAQRAKLRPRGTTRLSAIDQDTKYANRKLLFPVHYTADARDLLMVELRAHGSAKEAATMLMLLAGMG
jgi:hypothetical protein